jgi:uncharacterized protein YqjF (DUF2071 family)
MNTAPVSTSPLVSPPESPTTPHAWPESRAFLTAEWRDLVMLNYEIDPRVLAPHIPAGVELDFHNGQTFVSLVGFLFQRTRVRGLHIPYHANFEEVNLRFYVRREVGGDVRRGVVFIREFVPRRAVTLIANLLYGENYRTVPMGHRIERDAGVASDSPPRELEYRWHFAGRAHRIALQTSGPAHALPPDSLEEFIAEHYWGYTALPRRRTAEYQVAHPPWSVCRAASCQLDADIAALYGDQFVPFLNDEPVSAFWANGSPVRVYPGQRLH